MRELMQLMERFAQGALISGRVGRHQHCVSAGPRMGCLVHFAHRRKHRVPYGTQCQAQRQQPTNRRQ